MKSMLKMELNRAFLNKRFLISLLLGGIITGSHILTSVLPGRQNMDNYLLGKGEYPISLYNMWIGGEGHSFQPMLFFMVLPLLACIPYSDSYYLDISTGYIKYILIKINRREYYLAKAIAVFISGGMAVLIPLLFNLVITAMLIPAVIPESSSITFPLFEHSMWSNIFYSRPFIYVLLYLSVIFLFSGLIAAFGNALGRYFKFRYLVILLPFILYTLSDFIFSYLKMYQFSWQYFLMPYQPVGANFAYMMFMFVMGIGVMAIILIYEGFRHEIY